MHRVHLANTNFEWELRSPAHSSLQKSFETHPIFLQLQFLPLLYADETEGVLTTHLPPQNYLSNLKNTPQIHLMNNSIHHFDELETWGWSQNAKNWADANNIAYMPPSFTLLRTITSKAFSYTNSPKLPGSHLLHTLEEMESWMKKTPNPKVIKTCFGLAGQGHFLFYSAQDDQRHKLKLIQAFKEGLPLIGEPWVKRLLDFSTQWLISKNQEITYLGATLMENSAHGKYEKTIAGNEKELFGSYYSFLNEHCDTVKPLLKTIISEGFFGEIGIDAMIYKHPLTNKPHLHPVVEINPRKTFGWLALRLRKKWNASFLLLYYDSKPEEGLLPQEIQLSNGEKILFRKQLKVDIVDSWKLSELQVENH